MFQIDNSQLHSKPCLTADHYAEIMRLMMQFKTNHFLPKKCCYLLMAGGLKNYATLED